MIQIDQPTIFGDELIVGVSSREDGVMKSTSNNDDVVASNQEVFLENYGIPLIQATRICINYDTTNFCRYSILDDDELGEGMGMVSAGPSRDGMIIYREGQSLFLPVADCVALVSYDTKNKIAMLSHAGRHSVEQQGVKRSLKYMISEFGSNPRDILLWLSPSVGGDSYPLVNCAGRSLKEEILIQLQEIGVLPSNIEVSNVDTAKTDEYFSHSEYIAGRRSDKGNFAVVIALP